MITEVECEAKRISIDLGYNYENMANKILEWFQRGHVWDPKYGWDGEVNRLRIHALFVNEICKILWYEGRITAYDLYGEPVFCSHTKWAEWIAADPKQQNRKLEPVRV